MVDNRSTLSPVEAKIKQLMEESLDKKKSKVSANAARKDLIALKKKQSPDSPLPDSVVLNALLDKHKSRTKLVAMQTALDTANSLHQQVLCDCAALKKKNHHLSELARMLQQKNKTIQEAAQAKLVDQTEKRLELKKKFQESIADISARIEQNSQSRSDQEETYQNLESRFKKLLETEQKYRQFSEEKTELKDREIETLRSVIDDITKRFELCGEENKMHKTKAEELEKQLDIYSTKFDGFMTSMDSRKALMNKMKKQMTVACKDNETLTKENTHLTRSLQISKQTITSLSKSLNLVKSEKLKLASLCRALQKRQLPTDTDQIDTK